MSDQPVPMVGPVYGFRVWDVSEPTPESRWVDPDDDQPVRLRSRGTTWTTPDQKAECRKDDDWLTASFVKWQNYHYAPTDPAEGWGDPSDHKPAHDPDCWCGLYAHSTLARCLDQNERHVRLGRSVLGLVKASGRMFAADRGFRAEQMEIDTLVCVHDHWGDRLLEGLVDLFRPHQPHVRAIAEDLGVDVVCAKLTKKSLSAAFANREGVYLWRKEAPWTSAATSSPTKSSSPRLRVRLDPSTRQNETVMFTDDPPIRSRQHGKAEFLRQANAKLSVSDIFGEGGGSS